MAIFLSLGTSVTSTICTEGGGNLTIKFFEIDPPKTPSGVEFTRLLLPSDVDNVTLQLTTSNSLSQNFPPNAYFHIQYNSASKGYFISMVKGIDRDGKTAAVNDDVNLLQYRVICNSTNSSYVYNTLNIQIADVNDNNPVFSPFQLMTGISELTDTGKTVSEISATDLDYGPNKQVVYSLGSSAGAKFDGSKYFTVSPGLGSVSVNAYLDFDSMYMAANRQSSQVFFNLTITAKDRGNPARSSSMILIITILDADDQGPGFVYPSCITRSQQQALSTCVRPKYRSAISSETAQMTTLQLTPDPADADSPDTPVNITMQDEDTLNSPVTCSVSDTIPAGYKQLFQARTTRLGQTKQYQCDVLYVPSANISLDSLGFPELELIIKAEETMFYKRSRYASIVLTILDNSSSYCPAGYNTQTTGRGVVICTDSPDSPETDTSVALGLGIALGFAVLVIIILIIVGIVFLKRRKPALDKSMPDYNTVDMVQGDRHTYRNIHSNGTDSGTSGYQNVDTGQSGKQTDSSYEQHIYDDPVEGSITRRVQTDTGEYVNLTV